MKRRDLLALSVIFFLSLVGNVYAQNEDFSDPWEFSFDGRPWVIGNKQSAGDQKIIEYVLEGESVENWSESVTSSFAEVGDDFGVEKAVEDFVTQLNQDCPLVEVNFIKEDPEEAVFEWEFNDCAGHEGQYEIKRISKVGRIIYELAYVKKTPGHSDEEMANWLSIIENAHVIQEPAIIQKPEDSLQEVKKKEGDSSKNKKYDGAINEYTKALAINPQDAKIYCKRAIAYEQKGDLEQAIADLNKAIEIDPYMAQAYSDRGIIYTIKNDFEKAHSDFSKVIQISPDSPYVYHNRGFVYLKEKLYDQSIADNTKAIELNPQLAEAYDIRGFVYSIKGLYDQAILDFSKSIELSNPQNSQVPRIYYRRALCYYHLNDFERSWADVQKAEELGHESTPKFIDNLKKASGRQ
jgi:tetratricopeptide (TPR) repeat protein